MKDRFTDGVLQISGSEFRDLFEIEIANFIEQVPSKEKLPSEKLSWYIEYFGQCR